MKSKECFTRINALFPVRLIIGKWIYFLFFFTFSTIISATPLNGNYTINANLPNSATNFHSFTDFANSINFSGISGDVIVTVVPGSGPYNEQIVINTVQGASVDAKVTLEGNNETLSAVTTSTNRHILRLSNVSYFTINNLRISWDPTSTGGFMGIHIYESGNHIALNGCAVLMIGTTSTLYGAYVASGSLTSILTTGDFHDITITGCGSVGGGYGASIFGLVTNLASNIVISGNSFRSYHTNGVYLRETTGAIISDNFFDKTTSTVVTANAIQIAQTANINASIFNNQIVLSQTANGTSTMRGIYVYGGSGHKVYNNVIHNINLTTGNYTAIEVRTASMATQICYNTISIDNPGQSIGNLYGIKEELSNSLSVIRNNMISIKQPTSGKKAGLVLGSTATVSTAFNSNFNNIYVPLGNVAQKGTSSPTYYSTLANWQSASNQDSASISTDPLFVSSTLPIPTNGQMDNHGTPITWVTTDFTGAARGALPDIGAYEFSGAVPNPPGPIIGDTTLCAMDTVAYSVNLVAGASSYIWSVGTGAFIVSGQGTNTIQVACTNTPFFLSVYASNSTGNSQPVNISIQVNSLPVVSFHLAVDSICYSSAALILSGGLPLSGTYSGNGVSGGTFNPQIAGLGRSAITYTYADTNNCQATAMDSIQVETCTDIPEKIPDNSYFVVYPNPLSSNAILTIRDDSPVITSLSLFNSFGSKIWERTGDFHEMVIERNGLPDGIYYLSIKFVDEFKFVRIVISK